MESHTWLRLKPILRFFSLKAARSGPRLVVQLAALLVTAFAITRILFPDRLIDALGYTQAIGTWATGGPSGSDFHYNGLRIVVFGEPGLITAPRTAGQAISKKDWTHQLCDELDCVQYLSFVPAADGIVRSITSSQAYNSALRKVMIDTQQHPEPGANYTFLQSDYPTPFHVADLDTQVNEFLSMKAPATPPSETIFVFSFGTWDVWHLAGFPLRTSYNAVDEQVRELFGLIEKLYHSARDHASIAHSASLSNATASGSVPAPAPSKEQDSFRIILPRLVDPSLSPGWKHRPHPPQPHSPAEHLKNAAYLTMEWNQQVELALNEWTQRGEYAHGDDKGPQRDAFVPDVPAFVVDSMIDSQLKIAGLRDNAPGSSLGNFDDEVTFKEARSPCMSSPDPVRRVVGRDEIDDYEDSEEKKRKKPCWNNLFMTDYTLGPRAMERIGIIAADMVINGRSVRQELAKGRGKKPPREGAPIQPKNF